MRRGKILILVPCLLVGGTEMHTCMLVRSLVSAGYRVCVCVYYEHDPRMISSIEDCGATVRLLGLRRDPASRNVSRIPALAIALARVIRDERPALAHVQYIAPGFTALLLARLLSGAPVVATMHVPGHQYSGRRWMVRDVAARLCDAFLCVSETVERSFFRTSARFEETLYHCGRRHFTIHNAVDRREVERAMREAQESFLRHSLGLCGRRVVALLSRLSPEKGPQDLLAALPTIAAAVPDVSLLAIGGGPDEMRLKKLARELGMADRVIWTGALPRANALRHLALADVVALPSHFEGFGLAAAEAMAMSKPVVASDVDGLRELVVAGHTGLLVPPADPAALAGALISLLKDERQRLDFGRAARQRIDHHFMMEQFTQRHLNLYAAITASRLRCSLKRCRSELLKPRGLVQTPFTPTFRARAQR